VERKGTVVQALVLAVLDARHHLLAGGFVAFEFVGDHLRDIAQALEELAKEAPGGALITARLKQDVEDIARMLQR